MLWAGDFNCHSPLWDRDEDTRLFMPSHRRRSENLIRLAADHAMDLALPKGIPTIEHMVTKRESRTDNVWSSSGLTLMIMHCNVDQTRQFTHTDHYSIVTIIDLPQERAEEKPTPNFRCRRELVLSPGFHRSCPVKGRAIPVVRGYHYIKLRTKTQV